MLIIILVSLLIIGILGCALALYSLHRHLKELKDAHLNDKSLIMLNQNMQNVGERIDKSTESLNARIDKTTEMLNFRLTKAAEVIGAVQKELGTVQERFKGFEEFNELLHPKMRGNIGEQNPALFLLIQSFHWKTLSNLHVH